MSRANKLYSYTAKTCNLPPKDIGAMYKLFENSYENTSLEKFESDLLKKDKIIILRDQLERKIRGFSSLKFLEYKVNKKKYYGIFSGDTLIQAGYRGQNSLTLEFFKNIFKFKMKHPFSNVYWFLISKGYKTYLLLTNNFVTYYPRFDQEIPAKHEKALDFFAASLFGNFYDPKAKVLKVSKLYDRLKKNSAPIFDKMLENPNIKFFSDQNPNWKEGEELCCIGRVDAGLCLRYLPRTFKKILKGSKKPLKLKSPNIKQM